MKITYRVPMAGIVFWYALASAVGGSFVLLFVKIPDAPFLMKALFAALVVCGMIAPLSVIGGSFSVSSDGLAEQLPFSSWSLDWDDIASWSYLELCSGPPGLNGGGWRPYVFIQRKSDGRIYSPHQWIMWGKRVRELAASLQRECPEARRDAPPVIQKRCALMLRRWPENQEANE